MLKTQTSSYYEVHQCKSYGCKLSGTFKNLVEAINAIEMANQASIEAGFHTSDYYILYCTTIRLYAENGMDILSETISKIQVERKEMK